MNPLRDRRVACLFGVFSLALGAVVSAETDLSDLFAKVSPSVVRLTTYSSKGDKLGEGSGFIVDQSGVIVTCLHVVGNAATIEVQLGDDSTQMATEVIRSDKDWDVSLLRVGPLTQTALKLAAPEAVRVGAAVVAIGSPLGYGNTLSQGIISGLRSHAGHSDLIQITAPISPGSSGGPILSSSTGEILGMASASQSAGQNLNFAIPARVIAEEMKTIDQPPERELKDFTPQIKKKLADAKKVRDTLETECTEADATTINRTIEEAIASGVGIYNGGDHLGCFRIYEGAAYKILFKLSDRSATVDRVLKDALRQADKANKDSDGATAKAWIMRNAFDSMVGVRGKHQ
jgi:S1-C subfamily serine protease